MASNETIGKALGYLSAMYASQLQKIDAETLRMRNMGYADELRDIDDDLLFAACKQVVAESEFYPTVATLRNKAHALIRTARGGEMDAYQAWGIVIRAASGLGRDASESERGQYFDREAGQASRTIAEAVRAIGWRDICNCDEDQLNTLRAQFRGAFENIANRQARTEKMLPAVADVIGKIAASMDVRRIGPARGDE